VPDKATDFLALGAPAGAVVASVMIFSP